jgi:serine/threonine protein phosphatase 1
MRKKAFCNYGTLFLILYMRRFVIGDIHGANKAILQCFERSGFDKHNDLLICLGDLCDGWPEVSEVLDTLLEVDNLQLLRGNHDQWMLDWLDTGDTPYIWTSQGGDSTILSFKDGISDSQRKLVYNARLYHIMDNMLFVHGGFNPDKPLELQSSHELLWDRTLVKKALYCESTEKEACHLTKFEKVFVGHTPTINFGNAVPVFACEICMLDTGARWPGGVLTMMDIDSEKWYSSDVVTTLYE